MFGRRVSGGDLVSTLYGRLSVGHGVVNDVHFQVTHDDRLDHPSEAQRLLNVNHQSVYVTDETPFPRTHELRMLLTLAVPVCTTYSLELLPPIVQVMFLGRLDSKDAIAAGALATMFTNVFGLSVGIGLSTAMDTLCAQAFGAGQLHSIGLWLQRGILLLSVAFIPVAIMCWYSGSALVMVGQPEHIAYRAEEFARWTIPAIYVLWIYELMKQTLQAQGVVKYNTYTAVVMNIVCVALCWALVQNKESAFIGIAIGRSVATLLLPSVLYFFIRRYGLYDNVWPASGWGAHSFESWPRFLRFGGPGMLMTCLDWWAFELLTLVTGLLPHPETAMSANMILFQTTTAPFSVFLGLSVACTIHVGNLLGAGEAARARNATQIAALVGACLGMTACATLYLGRHIIPTAFTSDTDIQEAVTAVMPLLAIFNLFDSVVALCFGAFRGIGLQATGAMINFVTQYCVALPLSVLFSVYMQLGLWGLWLGPTIGKAISALLSAAVLLRLHWRQLSIDAIQRACEEQKLQPT